MASGVYYAEIEDGLLGGHLKFRIKEGPLKGKVVATGPNNESLDIHDKPTTREVPIHEGRAVVFGNDLPHRFRALSNLGDEAAKRTFLTFFVVDPAKRIPSTADIQIILPTRLRQVVILAVRKTYNLELTELVVDEIGEFRGSHPRTLEEAKLKREEFRAAVRENFSGFCNCGGEITDSYEYVELWEALW